ncbi:MAG: superoxide dismutase family protein [Proteobacteria bacterium]|nr:superoxide dismutase family protein [Pseudomonadota bacterium]HQR03132.1 superoxide dismutase family protein [Rhodocyclaceae bacterium]
MRATLSFKRSLLCAVILCAGCGGGRDRVPAGYAMLQPVAGGQVQGMVIFGQRPDGLRVAATISGLSPGQHGFHIHEATDCSASEAGKSGADFNPAGAHHGHFEGGEHHAGDLPNLVTEASGNANYASDIPGLSIGSGIFNIAGRTIVIHARADDYNSQPDGNSGRPIACGVIKTGPPPEK